MLSEIKGKQVKFLRIKISDNYSVSLKFSDINKVIF